MGNVSGENDEVQNIDVLANALAEETDSDILLISSALTEGLDTRVIELTCGRRRRKNVSLFLATFGGDPSVAFRIARCLQRNYEKLTVYLGGYCKSAGTLLVTGAHNIVMDQYAELGPLDIQVLKDDGVGERTSGLTPGQALVSLDVRARLAFRSMFMELKLGAMMTTKTAGDIAADLVGQLYGPIYSQIDPMRLGELQRAQMVGSVYSNRLSRVSQNLKDGAIEKLTGAYPDHGFAIDIEESRELFQRIREPSETEEKLMSELKFAVRAPLGHTEFCEFFNDAQGYETDEQVTTHAGSTSASTTDGGGHPIPPAGGDGQDGAG